MGNLKKIARCIRNCNPLNIRRGAARWQGMSKREDDIDFEQFLTMAYGWRAAFILLGRTYYEKYHLNTIRKIISRWAQECENNTKAYIYYVAITFVLAYCKNKYSVSGNTHTIGKEMPLIFW